MQDIPATSTTQTEQTTLFAAPTWDTDAAENAAFSVLMDLESSSSTELQAPVPVSEPAPQPKAVVHNEVQDQARTQQAASETEQRPAATQQESSHGAQHHEDADEDAAQAAEAAETVEDIQEEADNDAEFVDMKDVQVDAESFQTMRDQLARFGLSEEDIASLERKVNSEEGITWGELVSFISKNMDTAAQPMEMTAAQEQQLMTFFQKLGFSAPESERMVADLAEGKFEQISQAVEKQLTSLPQDKLAGLDKEELDAFNELMKKFESQAKSEDRALVRVVGKAMENAMDKARNLARQQVESQQASTTQGNVKTIAETATKVDTDISKAALFSDETPAAEQAKNQAKDTEKLVKSLAPEEQLKARVNQAQDSAAAGAKDAGNKNADSFLKQDNQQNDKAWNEFVEKLQVEEGLKPSTGTTDTTKGLAEALAHAKSTTRTATQPLTRTEAPRVLKQVENAILKNLSGGGKRLTLQLNPEHLGTVNVALSVKNSEVSATIRADNADAGRMIADQLEAIRQSLEDQGLKVNKLEVQTQLPGGEQNSWQNMAGQDKAFQQGMWSKMRQGMNGNGMDGMSGMTAEQLSEMAREAILSENGNGLHVVA